MIYIIYINQYLYYFIWKFTDNYRCYIMIVVVKGSRVKFTNTFFKI